MLECAQEVYFINLIEWDVIEVCVILSSLFCLLMVIIGLNITNNLCPSHNVYGRSFWVFSCGVIRARHFNCNYYEHYIS